MRLSRTHADTTAPPPPEPQKPATSRARPRLGLLLATVTGVLVGYLLLTGTASAATTHVVALAGSVDEVITNIRNWLMGLLAGLATVFLTIGGVRYILAGGDPGQVEKAKTSFTSALIGYGLAALAPLVVTILRGLVGA